MSNESDADDSSSPVDGTLALIISILREHEQNLDGLISKLNDIKPQENTIKELNSHIEKLVDSVSGLERELKQLSSILRKSHC